MEFGQSPVKKKSCFFEPSRYFAGSQYHTDISFAPKCVGSSQAWSSCYCNASFNADKPISSQQFVGVLPTDIPGFIAIFNSYFEDLAFNNGLE